MRVEKKAFAYRIYRHFTQQCIVWLTWKIQFCSDNILDLDICFVVLVVACDELLQWRHLTCCEPCNQKLVGADGRQQCKVPSEREI